MLIRESPCISTLTQRTYTSKMELKGTKLATANDMNEETTVPKQADLTSSEERLYHILMVRRNRTASDESDSSAKTGKYKLKTFIGEVSLWRQERVIRMGSHSPLPSWTVYKTLQKNKSRDRNTQVIIKRCNKYW